MIGSESSGARIERARSTGAHGASRARLERTLLLALAFAVGLSSPSFAALDVTYVLTGQSILPVLVQGPPRIAYIDTDDITGTGEVAPYSTGTFSRPSTVLPLDRTNSWTALNGELLGCTTSTTATARWDRTDCVVPFDGMIMYEDPPPIIRNEVTIRFHNHTGETADSILPGKVEVIDIDYFTQIRTPEVFDFAIVVAGIGHTQGGGAVGNMNAERVVDDWSKDLPAAVHSEVNCHDGMDGGLPEGTPSACENTGVGDENSIVASQLAVGDSDTTLMIHLEGDYPESCLAAPPFECIPDAPHLLVPASEAMEFSEDFETMTFEIFSLISSGHRSWVDFSGTLSKVMVPEPGSGLLQAAALGTLVVIQRRRRRGHRPS